MRTLNALLATSAVVTRINFISERFETKFDKLRLRRWGGQLRGIPHPAEIFYKYITINDIAYIIIAVAASISSLPLWPWVMLPVEGGTSTGCT